MSDQRPALSPEAAAPEEEHSYLSHQQILVVLIGLMAGMLLAALDQSIVGTALPRIVSDLGGLDHLSWVVTAYLLTSTAVTPLWGKISDLYGRRLIFQIAIGIFIIGSALCGLSQDMFQLILFRAIQGIGGGGLFAIAFSVIGDVIPARERGRYQGYFGAVFGVSSVAGPLLGGWFTDGPGWRWIFYINLPIGIAALVITSIALKLPLVRREHSIDYLGASLIVGAVTSLLLYLNWAGDAYGWTSGTALLLVGLSVVLTVGFVFAELHAKEPIIPMTLFRNSIFSVGNLFGFLTGFAMFGGIIYLPLYFQTVMGFSSTRSGMAMIPTVGGLLSMSIISGLLITRTGKYKIFPVIGAVLITTALFLLTTITPETPYWQIGIFVYIFGSGLGLCLQTITVAVQNSADFRDMGVATSSVTFTRQLGGAIGAAALGAVLGTRLSHYLGDAAVLPAAGGEVAINNVDAIQVLPEPGKSVVLTAYADAIGDAFLAAIPLAVIALGVSLFLKEIPLRKGDPTPETAKPGGTGEATPAPTESSERPAPVFSGR
ncbi:MAG: MFS transporter [Chloroflexota bacterium]|nr:MFS transporter [Chloroflexota bacterium]